MPVSGKRHAENRRVKLSEMLSKKAILDKYEQDSRNTASCALRPGSSSPAANRGKGTGIADPGPSTTENVRQREDGKAKRG